MRDDQANGLRRLFARRRRNLVGVGGLDATPVVCDLARTLAELGSSVLLIDRTLGEASAQMGVRARYELAHVVAGDRSLADVLVDTREGVTILPAARGLDELALCALARDDGWQGRLATWLADAQRNCDIWLINGLPPTGGDADVLLAIEPTAAGLTGAYAQIKALARWRGQRTFDVVVHRAPSDAMAQAAFDRVAATARRFLAADLDYRGAIPAAPATRARQQALLRLAQTLLPIPTFN